MAGDVDNSAFESRGKRTRASGQSLVGGTARVYHLQGIDVVRGSAEMRLVAKLTVLFLLVVVFLTTGYGVLVVSRQRQIFEKRCREEAKLMGAEYEGALVLAWQRGGRRGVSEVIQAIRLSTGNSKIRWVWYDAGAGQVDCPIAPIEWFMDSAEGAIVSFRHQDASGVGCLHTYYPVDVGLGRRGGLEFTDSMHELDEQTQQTITGTLGLVTAVATLSVLVMTLGGIRIVGRPLEALIQKTQRVGEGDFSGPIHLKRNDELGQLAESLNQMCDQLVAQQERISMEAKARLDAMQQLRHADRLKTVGRLAAGIAHELGTPLNVVSGRAGLIASGQLPQSEVIASAVAIEKESKKITTIIRQLLDFARRSTPQRSCVDLRNVVRQTTELVRSLAEKQSVEIHVTGDGQPLVAEIDPGQIQQVLTNILVNAIHAMPKGGVVTIDSETRLARPEDESDAELQSTICVSIRDEGAGIDKEHLEQIFEPFFTTKDVGEGTGLGLSIAYGIVREHGGWITVSSRPNEGSCFEVYLPSEQA
jgi:signal transduction histidine kinase